MGGLIDPIKILAGRFVSLSPIVRMEVTGKLLRWREENQQTKQGEQHLIACSCLRRKSFLEQFWDEVEAAHDDGLYSSNPFADDARRLLPYGLRDGSEQRMAHV